MSQEPLRFLHAAGARIDHQLEELDAPADEIRRVLEKATITAFQRMIAAAVEHSVDFVLLTGDTFDESDRSLRARVVLLSGLQELAEYGIPVFVAPGKGDPARAWQALGGLPDNVTLFYGPQEQPADIWRGERRLATIAAASRSVAPHALAVIFDGVTPDGSHSHSPDTLPHYIARGGSGPRHTLILADGIAHHPGSLQGIGRRDTGPRGCTLVECDAEGDLRRIFVPTAPVRRERLAVDIDPDTSWDELRGRMQNALLASAPETGEEVWLIEWTLSGSGPAIDRLASQDERRALAADLDWDAAVDRGVRVHHTIRVLQAAHAGWGLDHRDPLVIEFFGILTGSMHHVERAEEPIRIDNLRLVEPEWHERVSKAAAELDSEAVLSHSRRRGSDWFAASQEGPGA